MAEAVAARRQHGSRAVVMNGGTDIVIQLRERLIAPDYVIDIKGVPGLREIAYDPKEGLIVGACVTMNELGEHPDVAANYPWLAEAALSVGSKQVRNRATAVGNIVNASPLCDVGTPLYAANATLIIAGLMGEREVAIEDFITFVRKTTLGPEEVVKAIKVPPLRDARGIFSKVSRRSEVDLSSVCATVLKVGREFRLAFGAVAPTPVRLKATEALLNGQKLTEALIAEAAILAKTEVSPIDDIRASREYRLDVVGVIVKRSLSAWL